MILTSDLWVTDERGVTWSVGVITTPAREHPWFGNQCLICGGCIKENCNAHEVCTCPKVGAIRG